MTVTATPVTASSEPLDRDSEVKAYLRIDASDTNENTVLDMLITAARQHCEEFLRRSLLTQTRVQYFDRFPNTTSLDPVVGGTPYAKVYGVVYLDFPPLIDVTSVQYYDANATLQTLSSSLYNTRVGSGGSRSKGYIELAAGSNWPTVADRKNAVTVTYRAGYGEAGEVPMAIKVGMLWLIGHMYENREAASEKKIETLPMAVDRIWAPYRVEEFV